jgi:hypothetical protein
MKKKKIASKFGEKNPKVKVVDLTLPENWGEEDNKRLAPSKRKAIVDGRTADEKKALDYAEKFNLEEIGVPFVAFIDAEGEIMAASEDGAVLKVSDMEALYEEAMALLENEDDTEVEADTEEA